MRISFFEFVRDAGAVVGCVSAIANFLPPASKYNDYPRFKKFYETFVVNTIAWIALSIRAQYPSVGIEMLGFKQPPVPPTTPK